jgi:hypothetical protein
MAKKARASKAKTRKAAAKTKVSAPHPEDHVDGCLCDVDVPEHLYTRDEDLPPTKGGVASR